VKKQVRRLNLDGIEYGWRVTGGYRVSSFASEPRIYVDQFMAFQAGSTGAELRIWFTEGIQGGPGYIPHAGVVMIYAQKAVINLNKPQTAAMLIRQALIRDWSRQDPLWISNGFDFVLDMPENTLSLILNPTIQP
jgi:hypothetical protein